MDKHLESALEESQFIENLAFANIVAIGVTTPFVGETQEEFAEHFARIEFQPVSSVLTFETGEN